VTGGFSDHYSIGLKAVAAGTEVVRATVASAATVDPSAANNTASVSTVVPKAAASIVLLTVKLGSAHPAPGTLLAVSGVVRSPAGFSLSKTKVTCTATVGSRRVRGTGVYRAGRASCAIRVPATAVKGARIFGVLTALDGARRVGVRFSSIVG
jgi:hypothetical protein